MKCLRHNMYHNQIINQSLTLINKPILLGFTSDAEEVIAGGIQNLKGQSYFITELEIENDKDSPRIDFIVMFLSGKKCAIEVNGYQHFLLTGFKQGSKEYRNQWLRYFKKINWCRRREIPMIHINVLFDTRVNQKEFRKQLELLIINGTLQNSVNIALSTGSDVSINITKSGLLHVDTVRYESGLPDMTSNEIIKDVILGQGVSYNKYTKTITI